MDLAQATESDFHAWIGAGEVRRAGEWLVHRFADEVIGLCGAMVRDRGAAEDLAQDVFGRAFAALGAFRGDASARTWLLQIARNRCIDHLRAHRRDPWGGARDDETEPDLTADDTPLPPDLILRRADVEEALRELTEGERALVVLRFKNGLDYAELADAFGLREGTVRMRVSRALAKMRAALEPPVDRDAAFEEATPTAAAHIPPPLAAPAPAAPPPAVASAPRRRSMGMVERVRAAFGGSAGPVPPRRPAPPDHPLAHYFAATRDDAARSLRDRLVARARSL